MTTGEAMGVGEVGLARGALMKASEDASVEPTKVLWAMRALEKQVGTPKGEQLERLVGEGGPKVWRLVFVSPGKEVKKHNKGQKAGGYYFPITACQAMAKDPSGGGQGGDFRNGVFVGGLARMVFNGDFFVEGKKFHFRFDGLEVRLGPMRVRLGSKASAFLVFCYADEDIFVARGKSGGIALWRRASESWLLSSGVACCPGYA